MLRGEGSCKATAETSNLVQVWYSDPGSPPPVSLIITACIIHLLCCAIYSIAAEAKNPDLLSPSFSAYVSILVSIFSGIETLILFTTLDNLPISIVTTLQITFFKLFLFFKSSIKDGIGIVSLGKGV